MREGEREGGGQEEKEGEGGRERERGRKRESHIRAHTPQHHRKQKSTHAHLRTHNQITAVHLGVGRIKQIKSVYWHLTCPISDPIHLFDLPVSVSASVSVSVSISGRQRETVSGRERGVRRISFFFFLGEREVQGAYHPLASRYRNIPTADPHTMTLVAAKEALSGQQVGREAGR